MKGKERGGIKLNENPGVSDLLKKVWKRGRSPSSNKMERLGGGLLVL